ncbi:hypothetical protein F5Y14DRAFT_61123 [Nemania sp. NC0429]|nr:hypothetical protein F5Y14DRAFT_61123 [Nemania sp. NC0429]
MIFSYNRQILVTSSPPPSIDGSDSISVALLSCCLQSAPFRLLCLSSISPSVEAVDFSYRTLIVRLVQRRDVIVVVVVHPGRGGRVAYVAELHLVVAAEPVEDPRADAGAGEGQAQGLEVEDDLGHGEMVRRRLVEARLTPGAPDLEARERQERAVPGRQATIPERADRPRVICGLVFVTAYIVAPVTLGAEEAGD